MKYIIFIISLLLYSSTLYAQPYLVCDANTSATYYLVYGLPSGKQIHTKSEVLEDEISSGTLTIGKYYKITATVPDHFCIGCVVGDYFTATAETTCDENNKVRESFISLKADLKEVPVGKYQVFVKACNTSYCSKYAGITIYIYETSSYYERRDILTTHYVQKGTNIVSTGNINLWSGNSLP